MQYTVLGCEIEYIQAVKRLEQVKDALPGTPEARERQLLIRLFVNFEKDMFSINYSQHQKSDYQL